MFEYLVPVLIFVSLGVIIYIIGKHLPELRKLDDTEVKEEDEDETKKAKAAICKGGRLCKDGAIFVVESTVKKMKQLMHLIHLWILKVKKGKSDGSEASREIEVKQELIESEEQDLDRILNEDLAEEAEEGARESDYSDVEKQRESLKGEQVEELQEEEPKEKKEEDSETDLEGKIGSFFSSKKQDIKESWEEGEIKEDEQQNKLKSFLGKFLGKFSKQKEKEDLADSHENEDFFSDGIVDVKEVEAIEGKKEENLITEVVPAKKIKKKEAGDIDEEIGVDRSILEKKIVQKIANNPKDIENYRELGDLYIKMKNFSEAEECYRQVLKIHVRDADAKRKIEKVRLLKRMG